jgi:Transposase DDE domain group 1
MVGTMGLDIASLIEPIAEDATGPDPALHDGVYQALQQAIKGREGLDCFAASSSQLGRFETVCLATDANLETLADVWGVWIDQIHDRKPRCDIILDMDSSESPTRGQQEGSVWNGHFGCTCHHPLLVFNPSGDLERCWLRPGHVHIAEKGEAICQDHKHLPQDALEKSN